MTSGLQDLSMSTSQTSISSLTSSSINYANLSSKDVSCNQEPSVGFSEHVSLGPMSPPLSSKCEMGQTNPESPRPASLNFLRTSSTYAERISTTFAFSDGLSMSGSPKVIM